MNFLEEKILTTGVIKEGNILKVDSFLNHQIDIDIMRQMAYEFKRRFRGVEVNKVLTIEASGIAIATLLGDLYDVLKEESDTKRLSNIINRFVHGSASTFNQQTNVNLDNKFTVLDISELSGDLLPIGMFVALDFVWDKAKANRTEEKAIFIDECWQLIGGGSGTFGVGNRLAAEMVLEIL